MAAPLSIKHYALVSLRTIGSSNKKWNPLVSWYDLVGYTACCMDQWDTSTNESLVLTSQTFDEASTTKDSRF